MKKILALTFMVATIIYFAYKAYNLNYYSLPNINSFNINVKEPNFSTYLNTRVDSNYINYDGLELTGNFENFYNSDNNYIFYNEDGSINSSMVIAHTDNYLDTFKDNLNNHSIDHLDFASNKFFDSCKIYNDVDLIKFLKRNRYVNNTIFTSIKDMKINYFINYMSYTVFPVKIDDITLLNGINGYWYGNVINIIDSNNKRYTLTFDGDFFTKDCIKNIISNININ